MKKFSCKILFVGFAMLVGAVAQASAAAINFRNTDSKASNTDSGDTLVGFNMLNTGGDTSRLLIVTLAGEISNNATSVTYDGEAMLPGPLVAEGATLASIWYLINPISATGDIVLTKPNVNADDGYRFGAMSFGADADFLAPVSMDTASSGTSGEVTLNVTLTDAASPGNPFVAIGSYSGNVNTVSTTPNNSGFDGIAYDINIGIDGGYYAFAGYAIELSGSTLLSVTQSSNRHAFAGLAISIVPEPSTAILAWLAGLGIVLFSRTRGFKRNS
jgi:hypothetical protein